MRLAIDTGFLSLPPSGTGLYVRELLAALPGAAGRVGVDLDIVPLAPSGPLSSRARRLLWETAGGAVAARHLDPVADVVHVPHQMPPALGPRRGTAEVVTVHDLIPYRLPEYRDSRVVQLRLVLARRWLRRASRVIAPSEATAQDIVATLGIASDRIAVIPLAPTSGFGPASSADDHAAIDRIRQRYGIRGPYVFNIGGLDVRKNLPVLVEAFARTVAAIDPRHGGGSSLSLVIAGAAHSGNERVFPPLGPLIRRLGLERRVVLTGKVPDKDVLPLHRGAAVYCTPSTFEGFGLTPLDAMACGIPVVVANRTSLPEVVGDAGMVVEPSPEPVARALIAILSDEPLAHRLSDRSLARAARFSWDLTAERTLHVYLDAIGRR